MPDENSYRATQAAIEAVSGLRENDMVLFLLSGGGSALFDTELQLKSFLKILIGVQYNW